MSPPMEFHVQEAKVHSSDEYEDDDDVFYDELRRQVLQLTAEDDDDGGVEDGKMMNAMGARKQGPKPVCCGGWPVITEEYCGGTPAWMVNLWRKGIGTGVFIPQGVQSRRKHRSRRKNERGRTWRQIERMS